VPALAASGGSILTPKMASYAQGVYLLNERRLRKLPFGAITTFHSIAATIEERDLVRLSASHLPSLTLVIPHSNASQM